MYIGMSNDFYRLTKIASCAPGFSIQNLTKTVGLLTTWYHHGVRALYIGSSSQLQAYVIEV